MTFCSSLNGDNNRKMLTENAKICETVILVN